MAITQLIGEARLRAGLTRAELARRAGVAEAVVEAFETGAQAPTADLVERLVAAAGFEVRVGLGEPDPGTDSLVERTLRRPSAQRLADAAGVARFVLRGRRAMERAKGGGGGLDPARMIEALHEAGVRFVLIGGMAAALHGDSGAMLVLDVTPARDPDNLARVASALHTLGARIRAVGAPEGLAFDCSAEFLANLPEDSILNLTTRSGDLDLAFRPSGTQGYADLMRSAIEIEAADGVPVFVASLADVIRSKEAAGREKDRLALPRLRRLRDRLSAGSR